MSTKRNCHMKQPRNVKNYQVQPIVDGCWNCNNRYFTLVTDVGNQPVTVCALACLNSDSPSHCDEVDLNGKCDQWTIMEKSEGVDVTSNPRRNFHPKIHNLDTNQKL